MTSGTAPNTSLILTEVELDFIDKHFGGSKSAAIHKGLEKLMKELDAVTNATNEFAAQIAAQRAIAVMRNLPDDVQVEIAIEEFLRFKKFIDERLADDPSA